MGTGSLENFIYFTNELKDTLNVIISTKFLFKKTFWIYTNTLKQQKGQSEDELPPAGLCVCVQLIVLKNRAIGYNNEVVGMDLVLWNTR